MPLTDNKANDPEAWSLRGDLSSPKRRIPCELTTSSPGECKGGQKLRQSGGGDRAKNADFAPCVAAIGERARRRLRKRSERVGWLKVPKNGEPRAGLSCQLGSWREDAPARKLNRTSKPEVAEKSAAPRDMMRG